MSDPRENHNEWPAFLDRLIHDLREPLRSVHAFTELLHETAKDCLGPEGEQAMDKILSGTRRIRTLIDGLSGYSNALRESGDGGSRSASLQLAFNIAVEALGSRIAGCGATVTAAELPRLNVSLERLMQLMENLLANSLEFRGDAPPVIQVSAQPEADGWRIQVEDNGVGLDPEDCEAVFQPFARIHGRKHAGAGLGLAICRKIVEAHGGEIHMLPRPGGGAICTFRLPG